MPVPAERTRRPPAARAGLAVSDLVLALAGISVLAALLWPWMERWAFQDRVEAATEAVERTRTAMLDYREARGAWPPASEPGQVPDVMGPFLRGAVSFRGEGLLLQMRRWEALAAPEPSPALPPDAAERVEPPTDRPSEGAEAPPPRTVPLAGLTVHASEPALLAALLDAYGSAASFVRDTTWTLVLPRPGPP